MKNYFLALSVLSTLLHCNTVYSQSADCTGTPAALAVNATCTTTGFSNNDNGTTQTVNASCAGGYGTAFEDV
ncbi:MAG: hypothetical protein NXI10_02985 [bacterium]|nr:hypothetical protein [bacterium]